MTVYRTQFTYSAASTAFTPGATPTDIFTIFGSPVSNVSVLRMGFSTIQTTDGVNQWFIAKLSSQNTGGTHAPAPGTSYDSNNPVNTASVLQYTANPTLGVLEGYVWTGWVYSPTVTTVAPGNNIIVVDFEDMFGQPINLLSANEGLALNFDGAALPAGLSVLAYVVWTESPKT